MKRTNRENQPTAYNQETKRCMNSRGKNPSLFVAQPVKWMNLKDSQLSVRIKNVFCIFRHFEFKYRYETVNPSKVFSNSLEVKLNALN